MITELVYTLLSGIISSAVASSALLTFKTSIDKKQHQQEAKEIQEDADKIIGDAFKSDDVIDLMLKNVRELREYYIISKRQATNAFSASLIVCFLGFILIYNSNFAHRFCLCTLKIQYLAVIQLSKVCCYAA